VLESNLARAHIARCDPAFRQPAMEKPSRFPQTASGHVETTTSWMAPKTAIFFPMARPSHSPSPTPLRKSPPKLVTLASSSARPAAVLRSFITSCKRSGVEPFAWFRDVLSRIPAHSITPAERIASAQLAISDFRCPSLSTPLIPHIQYRPPAAVHEG